MDEFLWSQRYRPKSVSDCIIPDRLKITFQEFVDTQEIPNLMLCGTAGVGKTTLAMAMCSQLGLSHMFINASRERGIDTLRTKIVSYASTTSFDGKRKVIILDEADNLTHDTQLALRGSIEEFSHNCTFILTCNYKAKIIEAIHSRCAIIDFTLKNDEKPRMAAAFFKRLSEILTQEKVEYTDEVLIAVVKKFFPDYRRTLNEIQRYAKGGKLDAGLLTHINDFKTLSVLFKNLKEKDFTATRKWVASNSDIDSSTLFRKVYDSLVEHMKPESIPQAILILAKYQYQSAFVADQEINTMAFFTELMVETEML